ncbi:hypothetical protein M3J09_012121 [Ascochyta lentis]
MQCVLVCRCACEFSGPTSINPREFQATAPTNRCFLMRTLTTRQLQQKGILNVSMNACRWMPVDERCGLCYRFIAPELFPRSPRCTDATYNYL